MLTIPFQTSPDEYRVFVCLKDENISRIKAYDPAEIDASKFGPYSKMQFKGVIIGYVTDAEERQILEAAHDQIPKLLQNLSRGFKFRPRAGDNDIPYQRVKEN